MPFDRSSLRRRGPLSALRRVGGALALGAVLASCGGRAADGLEPVESEPGVSSFPPSSSDDEPTVVRPVRETCEDNPLLAGCPYANTGTPTPGPPVEPETSPDVEPQFIAAAQNVLSSNCGGCHGSALTEAQAPGAINYIDDWDELIQAGLIEECSPGRSPIIGIMRSGEMPPAASGLDAVSDADISVVASAIELSCRYDD